MIIFSEYSLSSPAPCLLSGVARGWLEERLMAPQRAVVDLSLGWPALESGMLTTNEGHTETVRSSGWRIERQRR